MRQQKPGRTHGLLFLTPYPDERFFGAGTKSIANARKQAAETLRAGGANKYTLQKTEASPAAELLESPEMFAIGHCSFGEFFELVHRHREGSPSGTVEGRLYGGLLEELARRGAGARVRVKRIFLKTWRGSPEKSRRNPPILLHCGTSSSSIPPGGSKRAS
jgi:hypothetical protein